MLARLRNLFKPKKIVEIVKNGNPIFNFAKQIDHYSKFMGAIQRDSKKDVVQVFAEDGSEIKYAMDAGGSLNGATIGAASQLPASILDWYGGQTFIGYSAAAILAQNWLINKCCSVPAKDAVRKGYDITVNDGTDVSSDVLDAMRKADVKYRINYHLEEFVAKGRIFGVRVAYFKVESDDPDYYTKPFNIDGVKEGSYKGIVQIDPYWCTPELDLQSGADPSSMHFYEPTWWRVGTLRIHRTHIVLMRYGEIPDILRPTYFYGGIPLPQLIYERVYCSDRTANEAPQLAMTKRTNVLKCDMTQALSNQYEFERRMQQWVYFRDNYGVKTVDYNEEVQQLDTSLMDLDSVIMTQYQLVAAAANVPVTKLLGTTPKGFNSTGEHEETSYHEELESIQATNLLPLLERHHMLLIRSEIIHQFDIEPFATTVTFKPLDALNAKELAELNKLKAETGALLMTSGAIDGSDERQRIVNDPQSDYSGLDHEEELAFGTGDPDEDPEFDLDQTQEGMTPIV